MSETFSPFDYNDYKAYLQATLDRGPHGGRSARSRLSTEIGIQTAYTAQVLKGSAHFSLEQAELINDFLVHTEDEGQFFLLLVQRQRAGIQKLKRRFDKQIQMMRESRKILKVRLAVDSHLSEQNQLTYYSAWYYAALHVLMSVPGLRGPTTAAKYLQLDPTLVASVLEFLDSVGLITASGVHDEPFKVGKTQIHLGSDSPLIARHHINWRLQAIRSLERARSEDLHYSSIVSLSSEDAVRIRESLVKEIERIKAVVRASPEERVQCFSLDFFEL